MNIFEGSILEVKTKHKNYYIKMLAYLLNYKSIRSLR